MTRMSNDAFPQNRSTFDGLVNATIIVGAIVAAVLITMTIAGANVVRLKLGSTGLGLFDAKGGPRPGVPHHTFDFEGPREPDAMVQELEAKGIKVENIRMHGNGPGYSVYVYDHCGNRIELSTDPT